MLITVINDSDGLIDDNELLNHIRAVNRQIDHDFRPYWHLTGELRLGGKRGKLRPDNYLDTRGDAIIFVQSARKPSEDIEEGIAAFHDKEERGVPVAYVFAWPNNPHWQLALSHEALELIVDPLVNLYVHGPHPDRGEDSRLVFHAAEVCDAVQEESYLIDGYRVSNFLLPLYFMAGGHNRGRIVFLDRKDVKGIQSFGLNPGGYIPFFDPTKDKEYHYYLSRNTADNQLVGNYLDVDRKACYTHGFLGRKSRKRRTSDLMVGEDAAQCSSVAAQTTRRPRRPRPDTIQARHVSGFRAVWDT